MEERVGSSRGALITIPTRRAAKSRAAPRLALLKVHAFTIVRALLPSPSLPLSPSLSSLHPFPDLNQRAEQIRVNYRREMKRTPERARELPSSAYRAPR